MKIGEVLCKSTHEKTATSETRCFVQMGFEASRMRGERQCGKGELSLLIVAYF